MSDPYCSQKRRRIHEASTEQGDSIEEYSRKNVKQTDDTLPGDRVSESTSTSRPQGKKHLFVLPHPERDTEELNGAADRQRLDAELVSCEHHSLDVESLCAELQLKSKELERMRTEVVERNTVIAKLRADLVERETILREVQVLVSKCSRQLQGALGTGFTACQNVFDRMQTRANDRPAAEEGSSSSTRKENPAARSCPLSLDADDSALRKEEQQLSG